MNGSCSQVNRTIFDVDCNATVGNSANPHDDFTTFVASIVAVRIHTFVIVTQTLRFDQKFK